MKKFLVFGQPSATDTLQSLGLFILRLFAGIMMLTHGLDKLLHFSQYAAAFPDPIGLGSTLSLVLVIGAEVGCSLLILFGLFTRLAVLPLIFNMIVAAFIAHAHDPFAVKELALVYLGIFIALFFTGSGKWSVEHHLFSSDRVHRVYR